MRSTSSSPAAERRTISFLVELGRWLWGSRRRYRVSGTSMEPALHSSELILIDPNRRPAVGDIVVCQHPFKNVDVVKYVDRIDPPEKPGGVEHLWLRSPSGTDSTQFGRPPITSVVGVVTASLTRRQVISRPTPPM